jgi:general secretion pathway protein F/type IV pilus assembly protein PilC
MPDFNYEAINSTGQKSNGTLTAVSEREVLAMLDAKALFPVRIAMAKGSIKAAGRSNKKVKPRQMAAFFSQMADLLRSGVPLLRSLDILERQGAETNLGAIIREVKAKVSDGTSLADSMAEHPRAFSELAVSMVHAGQEGGFLEDVLKRIADFTEQQEDLKAKVVGAMAYPVFLAIIGGIILNVLIIFFVPQFEPVFEKLQQKGQLPPLTSGLLAVSHFMQSGPFPLTFVGVVLWWSLVVFGLMVAFFGFMYFARSPKGRMALDGLRLRLPQAGKIYLHLAVSRFTRILGTMLHNGIPILQALRIAKDSTGNRVLAEAINKAADNITGGKTLAAPLAACKYFPRDIVEMVTVGEESNSLETVLIHIADSLEKRTTRQLELFVRLLEPIMLLVMAAVTLVVVAGLLLPVFKMGQTMQ